MGALLAVGAAASPAAIAAATPVQPPPLPLRLPLHAPASPPNNDGHASRCLSRGGRRGPSMQQSAVMSTPSVITRWRRTAAVHSGSRSGRPRCTDESANTHMAVAVRVHLSLCLSCPIVCAVSPCTGHQPLRSHPPLQPSHRTHPSRSHPLRHHAALGACCNAPAGPAWATYHYTRLTGSLHSDHGPYRSRACTYEPALAASRCGGGVAARSLIVVGA